MGHQRSQSRGLIVMITTAWIVGAVTAASATVATPVAAAPPQRYVDVVFPQFTFTPNVVYGHSVDVDGHLLDLMLDIYQPAGDTEVNRPVVFWVHGGGFTSGQKTDTFDYTSELAKRGYVAISFSYRLRPGHYFEFSNPNDPEAQNAVRDAVQDGQAAVRYVRAHASELHIDPAKIVMGGNSAGAVLSLGVGLMSPDSGASGNPGYSSRICLAVPNAGAMVPQVIDARDSPAVFFHGEQDPRVPILYAHVTEQAMKDVGLSTQFFSYPNAGHVINRDTVLPVLLPILLDKVVNGSCPDQTYAPGSGFHPTPPTRLVDSRSGIGTANAPWGPGEQRDLVLAGHGGLPASGVAGAVLNVTVDSPSAPSHLTLWPTLFTAPVASNINFAAGQTLANQVEVGTGANGSVSVRNNAGTAHVIIDLVGWFDSSGAGDRFVPAAPTRVLDTRTDVGLAGPFGAGQTRDLAVAGTNGVPANATTVVMTLTSVNATAASHLTAWPASAPAPTASNLNMVPGRTVPNMVTVGVGSGGHAGEVSIFNNAGTTDVIADVLGWYVPSSPTGAFTPVTPTRIVDTRVGIGGSTSAFGTGETRSYVGAGQAGVPPAGATAVVVNITVDQPSAPTHLTVFPTGNPEPIASNLNAAAGQTVANLTVVGLGTGQQLSIRNNAGTAHVIVDVVGWYG